MAGLAWPAVFPQGMDPATRRFHKGSRPDTGRYGSAVPPACRFAGKRAAAKGMADSSCRMRRSVWKAGKNAGNAFYEGFPKRAKRDGAGLFPVTERGNEDFPGE